MDFCHQHTLVQPETAGAGRKYGTTVYWPPAKPIAQLIGGNHNADIELKKGGMAQLYFTNQIAPGEGILQWLLRPKQLRLLGNQG